MHKTRDSNIRQMVVPPHQVVGVFGPDVIVPVSREATFVTATSTTYLRSIVTICQGLVLRTEGTSAKDATLRYLACILARDQAARGTTLNASRRHPMPFPLYLPTSRT